MDANKIIENLLDRIKSLTKENAFLVAQLETMEEQEVQRMRAEEAERNAVPEEVKDNE